MPENTNSKTYGDSGGASRFFYKIKASRSEREEGLIGVLPCAKCAQLDTKEHQTVRGIESCYRNPHPTVKPIELMRYLCRLITPPNGIILDPFLGSGTTGIAAILEGFRFTGIEREEEYIKIAEARIQYWEAKAGGVKEVQTPLGVEDDTNESEKRQTTLDFGVS